MSGSRYLGLALLSAALLLVPATALPTVRAQDFPPDLAVDGYDLSFADDQTLVLQVEVANLGATASPGTVMRASGWNVFEQSVPALKPEEVTVIEFIMPIPPQLAGSVQEFFVEIDPDGKIFEFDRDNNFLVTEPVELPGPFEQPPTEVLPVEEVSITGIIPDQIEQGEEQELDIFGQGFQNGARVDISSGQASGGGHSLLRPSFDVSSQGIAVVGQVNVINAGHLTVVVSVSSNAPLGLRTVTVINPNGISSRGFRLQVVASPSPTPLIIGVALGGLVLLVLGVGGLTLTVRTFSGPSRKTLQKQAKKQNPPNNCKPGARWVMASEVDIKPGRWKIAELNTLLYETASGTAGKRYKASQKLVDELNDAIRAWRQARRTDATVEHPGLPGFEAFATQVISWQALETQARDLWLEAKLEGGEAEIKFEEYRCKGTPGNSQWVKVRQWTVGAQATDRHAGTVKGPQPGEMHEEYIERTRRDLEGHLRELIRELSRL